MANEKRVLHAFLALRETQETTFKNAVADMVRKFSKEQGLFTGENKTFVARDGYGEDQTKIGFRKVASTVNKQLGWLEETVKDYFKQLFSIEKTNSSGKAVAALMVEGVNWGTYSSLELLRLRGILENANLKKMYAEIPVRKESELWSKANLDAYKDVSDIYQTEIQRGTTRTTEKAKVIVNDPHIKDAPGRPPITDETVKTFLTGDYTQQTFSGEASMEERASMQKRLDILHKAVIEALEQANSCEIVESNLGERIFGFIHAGTNKA